MTTEWHALINPIFAELESNQIIFGLARRGTMYKLNLTYISRKTTFAVRRHGDVIPSASKILAMVRDLVERQ